MQGKIIKGIAGFYYVLSEDGKLYECKAKGNFRNKKMKPLVGDNVEIEVIDGEKLLGNIIDINPRVNTCLRPEVSNVDQALCFFTESYPELSLVLLDKVLIWFAKEKIPCIICFNKSDLANSSNLMAVKDAYEKAGYKVFTVSVKNEEGIDALRRELVGKTTTIAGPSGAGKSSFINYILKSEYMETGEVSEKTEHGRHTTRHAELLKFDDNSFIFDTPGFSSLDLYQMKPVELQQFYPEFLKHIDYCRFADCIHMSEPDCQVKSAVDSGEISAIRYETYKKLIQEIKDQKPAW